MENLKLSLLENAEHFIEESIYCAIQAEDDERKWKFAILHIVQAIELYLKELLHREHPLLIFNNIESQNNDKKTVSLDNALKRIGNIESINFSSEDINIIQVARDIRNQFMHFKGSRKIESLKLTYSKLFGFLSDQLHAENRHISSLVNVESYSQLNDIIDITEELYIRAKKLVNDKEVVKCPICFFDTFTIDDRFCPVCGYNGEQLQCSFCRSEIDIGQIGEIFKLPTHSIVQCKDCEKLTDGGAVWGELRDIVMKKNKL